MSTSVIAVTHKEYPIPEDPLYIPLMAGSALMQEVPQGYARDDTGDNISASNRTYCELTGLYWAWKNLDSDNIGICHYRRYFTLRKRFMTGGRFFCHMTGRFFCHKNQKMSQKSRMLESLLTQAEADELMEKTGVVLPVPRRYCIETTYSQYIHAHHVQDLDLTREIISSRHPYYIDAYDRCMRRRSGHRFNMFIMKKELMDSYCTWLFDILSALETRLDISAYSEKDKRVFGYVAERLLDVWIEANEVDFIEIPYIMTEKEHLLRKAAGMIYRKLKQI